MYGSECTHKVLSELMCRYCGWILLLTCCTCIADVWRVMTATIKPKLQTVLSEYVCLRSVSQSIEITVSCRM